MKKKPIFMVCGECCHMGQIEEFEAGGEIKQVKIPVEGGMTIIQHATICHYICPKCNNRVETETPGSFLER